MTEQQPISLDPQAYKSERDTWSNRLITLGGAKPDQIVLDPLSAEQAPVATISDMLRRASPLLQGGRFTENEQKIVSTLYWQSTTPTSQPATLAELAHTIFGDTVTSQDRETRVFRALANMQSKGKLQDLGLSLNVQDQPSMVKQSEQEAGTHVVVTSNNPNGKIEEPLKAKLKPGRPKKELAIIDEANEEFEEDNEEVAENYDDELAGRLAVPKTQTLFFRRIKKYPLLNAELETLLFENMHAGMSLADLSDDDTFWSWVENRDVEKFEDVIADSREIKDLILSCNLRLVVLQARKYQGQGVPLMDLIQEGQIGLLKAIEGFDHESGFKFSTYATWWARQTIDRAVKTQGRMISLPVGVQEYLNKAREAMAKFHVENDRRMPIEEVEEYLLAHARTLEDDKAEYRARGAIRVLRSPNVLSVGSINVPIGDDEEDTIEHFVADRTPTAEEVITASDERVNLSRSVREEVAKILDPREFRIVYLNKVLPRDERWTLERIAWEYGLSKYQVQKIQADALNKLWWNKKLERLWEGGVEDIPSFAYGRSAERVAFRLGLVGAGESDADPADAGGQAKSRDFSEIQGRLAYAICLINEEGTDFSYSGLEDIFSIVYADELKRIATVDNRQFVLTKLYSKGVEEIKGLVAKIQNLK